MIHLEINLNGKQQNFCIKVPFEKSHTNKIHLENLVIEKYSLKMSNFLGVISNEKPNSPITENLSFTDLEYQTELLFMDTLSLEEDFKRKSEAIVEQEILMLKNVEQVRFVGWKLSFLC